jgi:receptor expression-enhancing protein 5/6
MSDGNVIPMKEQITTLLEKFPVFQTAEDATGVDKFFLACGGIVLALLFVLFGFGAGVLAMLVGFCYPAFSSFKALEVGAEDRQRFWLVYWVVYSTFCVIESFIEPLLYFVPFYYPIKLAFLVWLFYPQTKGALTIYDGVLKDLIKPYVDTIDSGLDAVGANMRDAMGQAGAVASQMASEGIAMAGQETLKKDL